MWGFALSPSNKDLVVCRFCGHIVRRRPFRSTLHFCSWSWFSPETQRRIVANEKALAARELLTDLIPKAPLLQKIPIHPRWTSEPDEPL
jgi:hypothetical protein